MAKGGYYAVAVGRSPGVFTTWAEAEAQVKGFRGARFKKLPTAAEARAFIAKHSDHSSSTDFVASSAAPIPALSTPKRSREAFEADGDDEEAVTSPAQRLKQEDMFYAVAKGHSTGVVTSWEDVLRLTVGFPGRSVYKKFESKDAALAYLADFESGSKTTTLASLIDRKAESGAAQTATSFGNFQATDAPRGFTETAPNGDSEWQSTASSPASGGSWYAVAKGRTTGVFASWNEAKQHVQGLFSASFKKFSTREEAEAFMQQHVEATKPLAGDPDPKDPDTLVAFCDGSALENGRRGCRAGFACVFPHRTEWNVAKKLVEARATNNRAEYLAALEALKRANLEDPDGSRLLYIFSDSMLLIRSMTEWVGNWQKKGWKKADGAPVLNRDLLERLMKEKGTRRVLWRHVKAHTNKKDWKSKWNDVADHNARDAALGVHDSETGN
ncbi:hypothetical protein BBJ28_00021473 [Nothophytophthora sp. Chile5]|nr:hypothetical protein BBJ28_00021473 [Nothophytophthora sp. Chile5]